MEFNMFERKTSIAVKNSKIKKKKKKLFKIKNTKKC